MHHGEKIYEGPPQGLVKDRHGDRRLSRRRRQRSACGALMESAAHDAPLLSLARLSAGYGANQVLRGDLARACRRARLTAIIGPNGHGKTTLLRTISGLVPACAAARSQFAGQPHRPAASGRDRRRRHRPCAAGRPAVPRHDRARESADGRLSARGRRSRWRSASTRSSRCCRS